MEHLLKITTISEFHKILNLSPPDHPLISIIHDEDALGNSDISDELYDIRFITDMYTIMFKDNKSGSIGYGRNSYDFEEGTLTFIKPNQTIQIESQEQNKTMKQNKKVIIPTIIRHYTSQKRHKLPDSQRLCSVNCAKTVMSEQREARPSAFDKMMASTAGFARLADRIAHGLPEEQRVVKWNFQRPPPACSGGPGIGPAL